MFKAGLAALALMTGLFILPVVPATAQEQRSYCPIPEHGTWVTRGAKPRELTQIEVTSRCEDDRVFIRARAFTSCIPRDCKWGWTDAFYRADGSLRVELKGFYGMRIIDMRMFGDQRMEATVIADPHDPRLVETITTHMLTRRR